MPTPLGTVGVASHWTKVAGGGLIKIGSRAPKASIESPLCGRPSDRDDAKKLLPELQSRTHASSTVPQLTRFRFLGDFAGDCRSLFGGYSNDAARQFQRDIRPILSNTCTSVTAPMSRVARPVSGWIRKPGPMPNWNPAMRPSCPVRARKVPCTSGSRRVTRTSKCRRRLGEDNFGRADRSD